MNNIVKSVKHIHIQQIANTPTLFQAIITYQPYLCLNIQECNELDNQKKLINKLVGEKWFAKNRNEHYLDWEGYKEPPSF